MRKDKQIVMEKIKKLFNKLQLDSKSILFTVEQLNDKILKKLKKLLYEKDKENFDKEQKSSNVPIKTDFVQKNDGIDRSTL